MSPTPQDSDETLVKNTVESLPPTTDAGDSPDIFSLAWRIKYYLAVAAVVGLGLGELGYLKLGPMYETKGQILVSKKTATPVKERDMEQSGVGERTEHIALILSPLILDAAVKKGKLDQLPSMKGAPDPSREILDYLKVKRSAGLDRAVLNVLDLTYVCPKRGDGIKIIEAVIDAYHDYLIKTKNFTTLESEQTHADAVKRLTADLDAIQTKYMEFRRKAPLHWKNAPGKDGTATDYTNEEQERMLSLDQERRLTLNKQVEVETRIRTLEAAIQRGDPHDILEFLVRNWLNMYNTSGVAGAGNMTEVGALQNKLLPLLLDEQRLLRDFGNNHPEVQAVQKEIQMVRDFYRRQGVILPEFKVKPGQTPDEIPPQDIVTLYLGSLKRQKIELESRIKELSTLYEQAALKAKEYAAYLLEDQSFNDEIKRMKKLLEEVSTRKNIVELSEKNGGFSMQQLSKVTEELQVKRQLQFLLLGAVGSMVGIFGWFYIRAMQDNTLKNGDELRTRFGLHVIGQVPGFDPNQTATLAFPKLAPSLCYAHRPASLEAESFRTIRTALYFSTQGHGKQVIQVTSAESQDGKSTLCSNLSLAIANSGKRILLIDADLRCPRLHELFGEAQRPGLSDVLAGEISLEDAVITGSVPSLHLLCAGTNSSNPSEMLGSVAFEKLVARAREKYDYVIIDTPPMMLVSDPCIVAGLVNSVILVLRRGKNRLSTIRRTYELLHMHKVRLMGVVLNDSELSGDSAFGYAYREKYNAPQGAAKPAPQGIPVGAGHEANVRM
ncbi:MAG: polysaccharide biosynthesis tyrosine autokinase [Planctomycetales bacterium]